MSYSRVLNKRLLDELIELYRSDFDVDEETASKLHNQCFDKARELEEQSGVHWCVMTGMLWAILGPCGLNQGAKNRRIYGCLKTLGWDVAAEPEKEKDNG